MAWKMIGSPKTRKVTLTLATEFANMTRLPHDRPLKPHLCSVINAAFERGTFRTCEWASCYCHETKQTYRVNGKHTSTLLSQKNGTFPKDLYVTIGEYEADTLQDAVDLYSTFDKPCSGKTAGDNYLAYASVLPELRDVDSRIISAAAIGICFAIWEESSKHRSSEERGKLVLANPEFVLWLQSILGKRSKENSHMFRMPVAAAMFKTWSKAKAASTDFWTLVRDESGPTPDCPDRKLSKFLTTSRLHPKNFTDVKAAGNRETYVRCLHAWNAWRKGERTSLNYFKDAKTPAVH
jgi:hypothetical protein